LGSKFGIISFFPFICSVIFHQNTYMRIRVFLTFDHELPLGGVSASYEDALFAPTRRVIELAKKYGVRVTFFSDVLCAYRYKEWDYRNFYVPYVDQLQDAIGKGHDIQLHIHPHWLTSTFNGTSFLPSDDFLLSDFKEDTKYGGIPGIIRLSIDCLNDICMQATDNYHCVAFRAGGYAVHPGSDILFNSLYNQGIRYDSSMAKGYYFCSGLSTVDFRKLPKVPNWIIDPDDYHSMLSCPPGILEIPIATIPKTLFEIPTRFKLKKYAGRAVENRGRMIHQDTQADLSSKLKALFSARMLSFDNHTLSLDYLLKIFGYNVNLHKNKHEELMFSVISHPKTMGDYSFELMEGFISTVQKSFQNVEFTTFAEHYRTQKSWK